MTDVLLTGRTQSLIDVPEGVIRSERNPVALREVKITFRLGLLRVLDAANRRLDPRLFQLILQSLINLRLAPPDVDHQLKFFAVLRHITICVLRCVSCCGELLGSLSEICMLTQRLLIGGPEMRREQRTCHSRTVALNLDEIIIVHCIAKCTTQMHIGKHPLEIHAKHIDTNTCGLMNLVLIILKQAAARTVAALNEIQIA